MTHFSPVAFDVRYVTPIYIHNFFPRASSAMTCLGRQVEPVKAKGASLKIIEGISWKKIEIIPSLKLTYYLRIDGGKMSFLLGFGLFSGAMLVLRTVAGCFSPENLEDSRVCLIMRSVSWPVVGRMQNGRPSKQESHHHCLSYI